jgi:hypothetical protein
MISLRKANCFAFLSEVNVDFMVGVRSQVESEDLNK